MKNVTGLSVESVIFNSDRTLQSNDYVYISEFQFSYSDSSLMKEWDWERHTYTHMTQRNLNLSKILSQLCLIKIGLATSYIKSPRSVLLSVTLNNHVPEKEQILKRRVWL